MSSSFLDQLNLTPQERRIVVIIALVVFVVLNVLLVIPHFSDLGVVQARLDKTRKTIADEDKEVLKDQDPGTNGYRNVLNVLQRQQGGGVGTHGIQLQRTVSDQAFRTGVALAEIRPVSSMTGETNQFYDEQSVRVSFECQEPQLVNFLYNVGNDPAMIRVQEINLRTADANRYRLKGDAVLTANYARETPLSKPAPAGAKTPTGTAPKPGGPPSPQAPRVPLASVKKGP